MGDIQRTAQAKWTGDLRKGSGTLSTAGGAVHEISFSVPSRFESAKGTNPEELIAAAHAGCFSMMLSKILGDMKRPPGAIRTEATLTLSQRDGGWKITGIRLRSQVSAAALDEPTLRKAAELAKEQCPVSVLLKPGLEQLTLEVRLAGAS